MHSYNVIHSCRKFWVLLSLFCCFSFCVYAQSEDVPVEQPYQEWENNITLFPLLNPSQSISITQEEYLRTLELADVLSSQLTAQLIRNQILENDNLNLMEQNDNLQKQLKEERAKKLETCIKVGTVTVVVAVPVSVLVTLVVINGLR